MGASRVTLLGLGAFLFTQASLACDLPEEVPIPNGATATESEMRQGSDAVKRFITETQLFLQCLESEHNTLRTTERNSNARDVVARENQMTDRHNDAVTRMEAVARAFNEAIAEYEARNQR